MTESQITVDREQTEQEVDIENEPFSIGGEGHSYTAGEGLKLENYEFSADTSLLATKQDLEKKQDKLTPGENITIEDGVISAKGGKEAKLYDETGTNTDGSMTQLATSNMIYPSGSETTKNKIAIGKISKAEALGSLTIQISSSTSESQPITSLGAVSVTSGSLAPAGNYAAEYGNRTKAGNFSVAIGSLVTASDNNVAIGSGTYSYGQQSVAIGYNSKTGNTPESGKNYSVSLGSNSSNTRDSEVSVGNGTNSTNFGTRFVANVRDPEKDQDAATKKYVDELISALDTRIKALEGN